MLKRFTLFTLLAFSALYVHGQAYLKESNNWYFGNKAGIRFYPNITLPASNGNPISVSDARLLDAGEGTCAMSDTSGNLLFYVGTSTTGGAVGQAAVFNRNHQIMPNAQDDIIGGSSSSQNAIAVRKPGSFRYYYIFSAAQNENNATEGQGFYYSLVDMQLDGGLGDVVDSVKNREIIPQADEKVTAVLHRNGRWVWVVGHRRYSNEFVAMLVTENGVQGPFLSQAGIYHRNPTTPTDDQVTRGCMKLSPNGNRIGVAITSPLGGKHYMQVLRFNNLTGEVFDPITFTVNGATGFGPYGVEFSPDNSKVYFSDRQRDFVYQYDLCAGTGDSVDIVASKVQIPTTDEPMTLQLGLNGRIYLARGFSGTSVAYFRNPNEQGRNAVGFTTPGVALATGTSTDRGLTNVNQSIFNSLNPRIEYVKLCEDSTVEFAGQAECQAVQATYTWDFGDPNSGAANVDNIQFPRHRYTKPGRYTVKVVIDAGNIVDTATEEIVITPRPRGTIAGDKISCKVLTPYTFIKDTSLYNPQITDYYWRLSGVASSVGVPSEDTTFKGVQYNQILFNHDTNQTIHVRAVAYSTTSLGEKCPSDSANLTVIVHQVQGAKPQGLDTTCLVVGTAYNLTSSDSPRTKFRWLVSPTAGLDSISNSSTGSVGLYFSTPGRRSARVDAYKDTAANVQTCFTTSPSFTFYLAAPPGDSIRIFGDSAICDELQVVYMAEGGRPSSSYIWEIQQPGSQGAAVRFAGSRDSVDVRLGLNSALMQRGDNIYYLTGQEVSIDGCKGPVTRKMLFNSCLDVPNITTANSDVKNDVFYIPNAERYSDNELTVYNSYGRKVYSAKGYRNDMDNKDLVSGTYYYHFRANVDGQERIYKGWLEIVK